MACATLMGVIKMASLMHHCTLLLFSIQSFPLSLFPPATALLPPKGACCCFLLCTQTAKSRLSYERKQALLSSVETLQWVTEVVLYSQLLSSHEEDLKLKASFKWAPTSLTLSCAWSWFRLKQPCPCAWNCTVTCCLLSTHAWILLANRLFKMLVSIFRRDCTP